MRLGELFSVKIHAGGYDGPGQFGSDFETHLVALRYSYSCKYLLVCYHLFAQKLFVTNYFLYRYQCYVV